ncbi:ABC transporter ATP-binding protein [Arthrobacter sp. 35W]|uniref:ABC transporter ATP-binding protein n=1 Tax=Arthrobacter sp. 35W TaxID=1132441 RepID=UPI0003F85BE3|nr:oligopeptide/dipeptide ABC transporter ATP-binding protein [Arthrobacter sp. 35W]
MSTDKIVLQAEDLKVSFPVRRAGHSTTVQAVRGVDIRLRAGETLGLVGESGSGKSTLARALMRLIPSEGTVKFDGLDVSHLKSGAFRKERKRIQMVFQDPYSSLNPSLTVGASIAEPLKVHTKLSSAERAQRISEVLTLVGLNADYADRYPDEFSGGQRQRIAIARAIVLNPEVLVCDEAVSALDVSTQNQVINLLEELRDKIGLSYLFISHDLAVVRHISDYVAVMYLGEIVEEGPVDRIFEAAAHPYTQVLLNAVPVPDPVAQRATTKLLLRGDIPDPTNPPSGCAFHQRCPFAMAICAQTAPPKVEIPGGGAAKCHLHTSGPVLAGRPINSLTEAEITAETATGKDGSAGESLAAASMPAPSRVTVPGRPESSL